MFAYYSGTGSQSTAVDADLMRDLIELSLIEEYHWTPDYIATLPYKWIQKHNYMRKIKFAAEDNKRQIQKFKSGASNRMKPGEKRWQEV